MIATEEYVAVGKFEVESGVVIVSDPCYDKDTWCNGILKNVRKGEWVCDVIIKEESGWGKRVACLIAKHKGTIVPDISSFQWEAQSFDVGVDSGQAGIFDEKYFKDDKVIRNVKRLNESKIICAGEPWYSMCCDRTLNSEHEAGTIPCGVVSSSGLGDGAYVCHTVKSGKQIVGIFIDFGLEIDQEEDCCPHCGAYLTNGECVEC